MMLNDSVVRTAKPGIIWDSHLKGFGLRTGKNVKTFIVLVAHGRWKRIGRYPHTKLAEARKTAKGMLAEKTLGKIIPTATAFEDARKQFLEDCATRLRPLSVKLYTFHLGKLSFGRRNIADIQPKEIIKALTPLTRSMKEHSYRIWRTFFQWCHRRHLIDRSPMERMEPPPLGKARERVLTDEELKKVYKQARLLTTPLQRLVWLLVRTGQRVGELRHLKWAYIASDRITLPGEITKNKRTHTFPISKQTHDKVMKFPRIENSEYVFPSARTHVRGKSVEVMSATSEARRDFQKECGVKGWTLHDIRRTFATNLQKLGVRLEVTEALLNHVSGTRSGIVGVYQRHNFFPEMQEAIPLWDAKLKKL